MNEWGEVRGQLRPLKDQRGVTLVPSAKNPSLRRSVNLDAGQLAEIEVQLRRDGPTSMTLYWAGRDEAFHDARSLRVLAVQPRRPGPKTCTFRLAAHPDWRGQIDSLRFDFGVAPGEEVDLLGVRGVSYSWNDRLLGAAFEMVTVADFGGDARLALIGGPGHDLDRAVTLNGESPRLRVSYGVPFEYGERLHPKVVARFNTGKETTLYEGSINPVRDAGRWYDLDLDLSSLNPQELTTLSLRVDSAKGSNLGPVLWANPRVLQKRVGQRVPPNVILVVVDTLRSDRMSLYGHERATTPEIDAWARKNAVVFDNAVSLAPWTLPSHASLLSGLTPLQHGVNFSDPVPEGVELLAETLRSRGYYSVATTGGGYLSPFFGLGQGFDEYRHPPPVPGATHAHVGKDAAQGVSQSIRWLEELPEPFFLFLHTYEVHAPYLPREPWYSEYEREQGQQSHAEIADFLTGPVEKGAANAWRTESSFTERTRDPTLHARPLPPEHLPLLQAAYDSGIAYVDSQLGRLLRGVEAGGHLENSVVVLTSDHGESLGEKGTAGHSFLWDFNLRVPLLIALPGGEGGGERRSDQAELIDVVPTILDVVGSSSSSSLSGRSLVKSLSREDERSLVSESYAASSNFGLGLRVSNRWKYIFQNSVWPAVHGQEELYDLAVDRDEVQDLSTEQPERVRQFRAEIERRFLREAQYLRVDLRNASGGRLSARLHGGLSRTSSIKAFHLPQGSVSWSGDESSVHLESGEELSLFLEGERSDRTSLVLQWSPNAMGPIVEFVQELVGSEPSGALVLDTAQRIWSEAESLNVDETGVQYGWNGRRWSAEGESTTYQRSEEVNLQLQALGYVD